MKSRMILKCWAVALLSMCAVAVQAATVWDENSNGDFSNDGLSPTSLVVFAGSNRVFGSTGNSGNGVDRDYFSFTVPVGATLTSIMLLNNTSVSGSASFIAIQAGPQLTVSPTGAGVENLLGFAHYGNDLIGTDILPFITFTNALPSGIYSLWVQETGERSAANCAWPESGSAASSNPTQILYFKRNPVFFDWRRGAPLRKPIFGRRH